MGKQLVMPQVHERTTSPTGLNSKSLDALRCVATRDTEDSREAGGRDLGYSHSRPSGSSDVAASGAVRQAVAVARLQVHPPQRDAAGHAWNFWWELLATSSKSPS